MENNLGTERKSSLFRFWFSFLILVILGSGIYFGVRYFRYQESLKAYNDYESIIQKIANDDFGGKTPKETLDLFVAALKEGDVDKAAKYFALDDNGSREKWVKALTEDKEKGNLDKIVKLIIGAESVVKTNKNRFAYATYNTNGTVAVTIDLYFNGKVWKIESL